MIPINMKDYNTNLQLSLENTEDEYDSLIKNYENINNFIVKCPECGEYEYTYATSYTRSIIVPDEFGKTKLFIDIKRVIFTCNCKEKEGNNKTHSLIPDFITPYKQHSKKFISESLEEKQYNSYKIIENKYGICKELMRFWKKCFASIHKSRVTILLKKMNSNIDNILGYILQDISLFNEIYYKEYNLSFMQFTAERLL